MIMISNNFSTQLQNKYAFQMQQLQNSTLALNLQSACRLLASTVAAALLLGISGCSSIGISDSQQARQFDRQGIDVVLDHSIGVGFVFKDEKTRERVCRTPGPDFTTGEGAGANLGLQGGPQVGFSNNFNAMNMGGRSPGVLVLREILYRACELVLNTDASPEQALAIYKHFISEGVNAAKALATSQGSQSVQLSGQAPATGQAPTGGYGGSNGGYGGSNGGYGSSNDGYGSSNSGAGNYVGGAAPVNSGASPFPPFNPTGGNTGSIPGQTGY